MCSDEATSIVPNKFYGSCWFVSMSTKMKSDTFFILENHVGISKLDVKLKQNETFIPTSLFQYLFIVLVKNID